jgi:ABC-type uncharacterized transport system permease subunit
MPTADKRGKGLRLAGLFGHYVRFNLSAGMEYRASFVMQVFGMALNNASFLVFWMILYDRLGDIRGYGFQDVMFLWALSSAGYGIAAVFMGNSYFLSRAIYNSPTSSSHGWTCRDGGILRTGSCSLHARRR